MSTAWVAGTVRAKGLTRRRVGAAGARDLAGRPTLAEAAAALAATPYGHDVTVGRGLAELQHAVGATALWHLRVLAGWLPREGADVLRVLAGGFEVANLDEQLARLQGRPHEPAYRLGHLETAWSRLAATTSLDEVRHVLATSRWGDPGSSTPRALATGVRLVWADRVVARVPEAASWARAGAAQLLAHEVVVRGRPLDDTLALRASSVLGPRFVEGLAQRTDLAGLADLLGPDCTWALSGVERPEELWRAQAAWYRRVEQEGLAMLHRSGFGRAAAVGTAAVLAVDAWRVRAALETAARGGSGAVLEAFDVVA